MTDAALDELLTTDRPALLGDEFLTPEALARELHISPRTLARWHVERVAPPRIAIGRTVIYRRDAVRNWLLEREEQPARKGRR
jgi:AraC-like DNA-binding protein